jgi:hypothetical protein
MPTHREMDMAQQPTRLRAAAERDEQAAHRDRDLRRMLSMYLHLCGRYVAAQAHGDLAMEAEVLDLVVAVEDALRARHRRQWGGELQARLQRLLLDLDHRDPAISAADCPICRQLATRGMPVTVAELLDGTRRPAIPRQRRPEAPGETSLRPVHTGSA